MLARLVPILLDPDALAMDGSPSCRLRGSSVWVNCDPYSPFHRSLFFFGTLYERELDLLLRKTLRPGDTFVDVGANYGHMSALASSLVGPSGVVHSIEPHPSLAARIRICFEDQKLDQIRVHGCALGDCDGWGDLRVGKDSLEQSTMRDIAGAPQTTERVRIRRMDSLLSTYRLQGRIVVKIDVEGFEPQVIRGMGCLLKAVSACVVEVTPAWIDGVAGVERLFEGMHREGFGALQLTRRRHSSLICEPLEAGQLVLDGQYNVLFAKPAFVTEAGL